MAKGSKSFVLSSSAFAITAAVTGSAVCLTFILFQLIGFSCLKPPSITESTAPIYINCENSSTIISQHMIPKNKGDSSSFSSFNAKSEKTRLWSNMLSVKEQEEALQRVGLVMKKYGKLFTANSTVFPPWESHDSASATLTDLFACADFGKGWGAHKLCGPAPKHDKRQCHFISFGISNDYSFDVSLANVWNCRGFAGDPTVVHKSQLHPNVTFHNMGASTLVAGNNNWWKTSMPSLVRFLQLDYVDVLKMDCEGCEYALPHDIILEDPTFFHRVGQISLEIHVTKGWIKDKETLYYLGLLFELMEEAGLKMAWSVITWCGLYKEKLGCMPQLEEWGLSCGVAMINGSAVSAGNKRGSCHNFLFARPPPASAEKTAPTT